MTIIRATVQSGRLEVTTPLNWPDGTEVEIHLVTELADASLPDVLSEEEIVRTLAAMDRMIPMEFTEAETAAWEHACKSRKEQEKAHFSQKAAELRGDW